MIAQVSESVQEYDYGYDEPADGDVWDDDAEANPYNPPRVNIPETSREKMPEYYEE